MPSNRYQIEELLHQDAEGVVYLARDGESGGMVRLQRFFPFGQEERGLVGAEITAYLQGVVQLQQLQHPGLCRVLYGGCDEVDHMPYLIRAVRSAKTLADYLSHTALTLEQARWLAEEVLQMMMWLRQQMGHEVDWLDLDPSEIELSDNEQDGVSFRFTIDPMKWLGHREKGNFFREFSMLLENALAWTGRVLTAGNAGPFSQWLKKIKAPGMGIEQALSSLVMEEVSQHAPLFTTVGASTRPPQAIRPVLASAQKSSRAGWYAIAALVVIGGLAVGLVKWLHQSTDSEVVSRNQVERVEKKREPKSSAPMDQKQRLADIERRALELQGVAAQPATPKPPRKGGYRAREVEALREQMNAKVSVTETLVNVRLSDSQKTIYLEFDDSGVKDSSVCGRYLVMHQSKDMSEVDLKKLVGRKIRITGEVKEEFGTKRLVIDLIERSQIGGVE